MSIDNINRYYAYLKDFKYRRLESDSEITQGVF